MNSFQMLIFFNISTFNIQTRSFQFQLSLSSRADLHRLHSGGGEPVQGPPPVRERHDPEVHRTQDRGTPPARVRHRRQRVCKFVEKQIGSVRHREVRFVVAVVVVVAVSVTVDTGLSASCSAFLIGFCKA